MNAALRLCVLCCLGVLVTVLAAQQPAAAPVFNAAQAAAGRTAYDASCASCHVADLGGRNEAPQLAGSDFMDGWSAAYGEVFGTPANPTKPARSTVGVVALVNADWLIEIEAFAVYPK